MARTTMRAVFIRFYCLPRAGGHKGTGIPRARLGSNGISMVGMGADSPPGSPGSVRMVNKAFWRLPYISGWSLFAPCGLIVARRRCAPRRMVNPVRLHVARALDGAIGPQGLR